MDGDGPAVFRRGDAKKSQRQSSTPRRQQAARRARARLAARAGGAPRSGGDRVRAVQVLAALAIAASFASGWTGSRAECRTAKMAPGHCRNRCLHSSPDTVLVLGAHGRFGAAACRAFAAAGWRVVAQMRRAPPAPLPAGVSALGVPLADAATLAATGAAVVVYAINPLYTHWDAEALPLLRQGLEVARRLGAHFMFPGNVYNFGEGMPASLDERVPEQPTTTKGRQRVAMEAAIAASSLKATVIRAGDYYGSGTGSWLDLLIAKDMAQGKLVYPGPVDVPHAWAYVPDLARAFVAAARREGPTCERLHFAGHTLTGRELLAAIELAAGALGAAPAAGWRHGGFPWALIRVAGLVWPMGRELARMSYLWRVPHALDGSALARVTGPLASTPVAVAMRQALVDLGVGRAGAAAARPPSSPA